jgi:undecaprenyl pyrophosphate synthase
MPGYSELYFTDVNRGEFRKIGLLRAVCDYQYRPRRYRS